MYDKELSLEIFKKYLFRIPTEEELQHHKITNKNKEEKETEFRNCNERRLILQNDNLLSLERNILNCIKNKNNFNSINNINDFSWENIKTTLDILNYSCNIAFCISGFVRNYSTNFHLFQKMLKYNPDIYIHTWDKEGRQSVERYQNFTIPVPILNNNIDLNDVKININQKIYFVKISMKSLVF